MKIYSKLLALCALQPNVWMVTAFFIQAPKAQLSVALHSTPSGAGYGTGTGFGTPPGPSRDQSSNMQLASNMEANIRFAKSMAALPPPVTVQGGALQTWSFPAETERVLVSMITEGDYGGNPLNANVKLCQGPDNTPQEMNIYGGKGKLRPVKLVIETPGDGSSVFIRNQSPLTFPIFASVGAQMMDDTSAIVSVPASIYDMSTRQLIQGNSVRTYEFEPAVSKVKCVLKTDGRPLNAQVELIQGPNAGKITIDVYTEDGLERPFVTVMETPGSGNSVRVINTGTQEFPIIACVEAYEMS